MGHRLIPFVIGLAFAGVLAFGGWLSATLVDHAFLTGSMLAPDHRLLPELAPDYVPDLVELWGGAAAAAGAAAALGFAIWVLIAFLLRPTGPGQATAGGRGRIAWLVIGLVVAATAFGASLFVLAGEAGLVDPIFMNLFSAAAGAGAVVIFWAASLSGTELAMRPAVPQGLRWRKPAR